MLSFLQIRDYAIVESIDLEFDEGFTCITGETGAGKSILVGALGLLTGQRADTTAVRDGCSKAELTAGFDIDPNGSVAAWLQQADMADGGGCLLRRVITDKGRSRAWINGVPVTLQQLGELGAQLVEIHGQNEHLRLLQPRAQFDLLDTPAEACALRGEVHAAHRTWLGLEQEKERLLAEAPLDAGDAELLEFHLRELEPALEDSARYAELDAEHRSQARADEIQQALKMSLIAFDTDDGMLAALGRARAALEPFADLGEDIAAALQLIEEASINCSEAQSSIERASTRMEQDPERLQELDRRLSRLHDLARKHRAEPGSLEEVCERLQSRLKGSAERDQRLQVLEIEIQQALSRYRDLARQLHQARCSHAGRLGETVTALMQDLGMAGGQFTISVRHQPDAVPGPMGSDQLDFLVSANAGVEPGPLRKVASGGELSRISLAIKVAARDAANAAVQVFDEVDAGIGGETARSVGALIRSLTGQGQALCVTHLAQVAVFADQQLQVSKQSGEDETRVATRVLAEAQRVDEIARMLGGQLSDQSRAHASELLAAAAVRH